MSYVNPQFLQNYTKERLFCVKTKGLYIYSAGIFRHYSNCKNIKQVANLPYLSDMQDIRVQQLLNSPTVFLDWFENPLIDDAVCKGF